MKSQVRLHLAWFHVFIRWLKQGDQRLQLLLFFFPLFSDLPLFLFEMGADAVPMAVTRSQSCSIQGQASTAHPLTRGSDEGRGEWHTVPAAPLRSRCKQSRCRCSVRRLRRAEAGHQRSQCIPQGPRNSPCSLTKLRTEKCNDFVCLFVFPSSFVIMLMWPDQRLAGAPHCV